MNALLRMLMPAPPPPPPPVEEAKPTQADYQGDLAYWLGLPS